MILHIQIATRARSPNTSGAINIYLAVCQQLSDYGGIGRRGTLANTWANYMVLAE